MISTATRLRSNVKLPIFFLLNKYYSVKLHLHLSERKLELAALSLEWRMNFGNFPHKLVRTMVDKNTTEIVGYRNWNYRLSDLH